VNGRSVEVDFVGIRFGLAGNYKKSQTVRLSSFAFKGPNGLLEKEMEINYGTQ
jgi:hypothetical protein